MYEVGRLIFFNPYQAEKISMPNPLLFVSQLNCFIKVVDTNSYTK